MNIDILYKSFLQKFESLFDTYTPFTKVFKIKLNFKDKSSIASGLQKSILKTTTYQRLLDLKTLVKKGSPNKIQIMQKSFMDSTKKSK